MYLGKPLSIQLSSNELDVQPAETGKVIVFPCPYVLSVTTVTNESPKTACAVVGALPVL